MKRTSLIVVLLVLVISAGVAVAGDPNDEQDARVVVTSSFADADCANFVRYPDCQSCWFMCLQALLADAFLDAQWEDF